VVVILNPERHTGTFQCAFEIADHWRLYPAVP
jgi:hypothetical protein